MAENENIRIKFNSMQQIIQGIKQGLNYHRNWGDQVKGSTPRGPHHQQILDRQFFFFFLRIFHYLLMTLLILGVHNLFLSPRLIYIVFENSCVNGTRPLKVNKVPVLPKSMGPLPLFLCYQRNLLFFQVYGLRGFKI